MTTGGMRQRRRRVPLLLRLAARILPRDARDEVLRELLEQEVAIRARRGWLAATLWAARQPLVAFGWRDTGSSSAFALGLRDDLIVGQRAIRRRPALALTVIATVAVSVGAIAAIVGVIDAVLLRPLPFPEAKQLVWISTYDVSPGTAPFDPAAAATAYSNPLDVVEWAQRERSLTAITPFETFESTVQAGDRPLRVDVASVRATVGETLRIAPLHGRLFGEEDYAAAARVVVLSHRLWQRAFGSDAALVGRQIKLAGEPFEVIGILPPLTLSFPTADTDVWVPLRPPAADFSNRGGVWQRVVARLDAGVSLERAQSDLQRIAADLAREYPDSNGSRRVALVPFRDGVVGTTRSILMLLAGAVLLVLLIAGANVGHLLLVNAQGRHRELAVRSALGAHPWRLARLLFAEAAWLAGLGGLLGLVVAPWLLSGFIRLYPDTLPAVGDVTLQWPALAAAVAATFLAALLAVVPSALKLRSVSAGGVAGVIRAAERGLESRTERRIRSVLVVTQVALSTALLVAGGLLLRTFWTMRSTDVGLVPGDVLTFNIALGERRYPTLDDEVRFYDRLFAELRQLPGVGAAGATTLLPLTRGEFGDGFYRVGFDDKYPKIPLARLQNVTAGYLEAVGLPLKAGRLLQEADRSGSPGVVVVNERLQQQYFPAGALGRQIRFRGQVAEIVGIVGDKKHRSLREVPRADMYFPRAQVAHPRYLGWVAVRVAGDPLALVPTIQQLTRRLDPEIAIDEVGTMSQRVDRALAPDRFRAAVIGSVAIVALLLASLGLYGLIAHAVARDARNIAIRIALGAGSGRTAIGAVGGVIRLTFAGVAIGVAVAYTGRTLVAGFLAGVTPFDPATTIVVVVTLIATATLAAAGPARRACRTDPAMALRQ